MSMYSFETSQNSSTPQDMEWDRGRDPVCYCASEQHFDNRTVNPEHHRCTSARYDPNSRSTQLQEGTVQLPEDVWEVSNLAAPDKRTRETAKLETEEPAHKGEGRLTRSKTYFVPARVWYAGRPPNERRKCSKRL